MTPEELTRLKQTELEILLTFDRFCREHSLVYYLIGGALLGSARHDGFIPWDDDIDVAMPREAYEQLQVLWTTHAPDGYFLQSGKTDPRFSRCILKLRREGTHIKEKNCANIPMHDGIYIDIFPIDYVPDCSAAYLARRAAKIRRLMSLRTIKNGYGGNHAFLKKLVRLAILPISNRALDRKIDRLCTKDNAGDRKYAILFLHNYSWDRQTHRLSVLGAGTEYRFEGHTFFGPDDRAEFLSRVFGPDYLQEPPKEKQKNPHHYLSVQFDEQML